LESGIRSTLYDGQKLYTCIPICIRRILRIRISRLRIFGTLLQDGEFTITIDADFDGDDSFGHNGFVKNCALMVDDRSVVSTVLDEPMIARAVNTWYDEESSYEYNTGKALHQHDISHFAQVL